MGLEYFPALFTAPAGAQCGHLTVSITCPTRRPHAEALAWLLPTGVATCFGVRFGSSSAPSASGAPCCHLGCLKGLLTYPGDRPWIRADQGPRAAVGLFIQIIMVSCWLHFLHVPAPALFAVQHRSKFITEKMAVAIATLGCV